MLTKNKNPKVNYVSRLLVLPLAAIVFFAFTLKIHSADRMNSYDGKTMTVVIDAGHGGADNGGISADGLKEKDLTLSIAKKIAALNSNEHIQILLTRDNNQTISVKDRVYFAKKHVADLFVSIHVNGSTDKQLNGFSVLIDRHNTEKNQLLASALINELKSTYKTSNEIEVQNRGLVVVDSNSCPAALIECGYLSNAKDAAFISNDANQEKVAREILNAIYNYASSLTESLNENTTESKMANDTIPKKKIGSGVFVDARHKVTIPFDKMIHTTDPEKTQVNLVKAVLIINGKIEPNSILKTKTIHAGTLTIHSGDEKDMIAKYGEQAKNGVFILDNATIKNSKPQFATGKATTDTGKIFTKTEIPASFSGGQAEWIKYITGKIKASIDTFTNADYGTCVVRFIVNTDGTVSDVQATTMKGTRLAQISVNAIKTGPKWVPASQNGHTVAAYRLQPVTLTNPEKPNTSANGTTSNHSEDQRKVFVKVEQQASFPGGQSGWLAYMNRVFQKNGNALMENKNNEGSCQVRFIVNVDGSVSDVQAITMQGTELANVAVNAIKKGPEWIPGKQHGHAVNSFVTVPVTFKLNDELIPKGASPKVTHLD